MENKKYVMDANLTLDEMLTRARVFHSRWYAYSASKAKKDKLLASKEFQHYQVELIVHLSKIEGKDILFKRQEDLTELIDRIADLKVILADERFALANNSIEQLLGMY